MNVDLNRGIVKKDISTEKLVECQKYIQDLIQMQGEIQKVSQEKFLDHLDARISKRQSKHGVDIKKFNSGDLVITVIDVGSKLDYR